MITTTTKTYSTDMSMDGLYLAMGKMETLYAEHLQRSIEMNARIEEMTCSVCGRKPTFIRNGCTEVLAVCWHTWEALQRLPKTTGTIPPDAMLRALRIKVSD